MASVLQQLETNEAILLMYAAGELPAEDRAEVERRLDADLGLREQLDWLREAYDAFGDAVARDDRSAAARLPVPEAVAVRRVGREMLLWQARRRAAAPVEGPSRSALRYPWWAYPAAAAASVVLAFLVWWGNTDRSVVGDDGVRVVLTPYDGRTPSGGHALSPSEYPPPGAGGEADAAMASYLRGELLAEALRIVEPVEPPADWDDSSFLAAVDPSDSNVLMGLNDLEAADDLDAAPDHDDISVQ